MRKILLFVICCTFVACSSKPSAQADQTPSPTKEQAVTQQWKAPTEADVDPSKSYSAIIKTSKGEIICELYAKEAPLSVTNFKYLADNGFYNGLTFHRVVPDFVIQGGDPTATGSGGPGYTIPAEIGKKHVAGALAWARTGDEVNPERRSSGSQFYITHKETAFLDGAYSVFGKTIKGMDVVNKIQRGDVIESITVKVE